MFLQSVVLEFNPKYFVQGTIVLVGKNVSLNVSHQTDIIVLAT
jgi:hypothetical protein